MEPRHLKRKLPISASGGPGSIEKNEQVGAFARRSPVISTENIVWLPLLLAGGALLRVANGTLDGLFAPFLFLAVGLAVNALFFARCRHEQRAFILSYSICVLLAGLSQVYMKTYFGSAVGLSDASDFFARIFEAPPYYTLHELATVWVNDAYLGKGAPLAIYIWQRLYHVSMALGFDFGPYIGVLFNALMVGLTASVTVNTARFLLGADEWRLRRAIILCASCGMFWLFGAILLRDCFTLFFNSLTLWVLVRLLCWPRFANLLLAGGIVAVSCVAMLYLRKESIILFGLFGLLAFFCWYWWGKRSQTHAFATLMIPLIALFGASYFYQYLETSSQYASYSREAYAGHMEVSSRRNSLGLALVVNQSTPIRAVLGTGAMLVNPIPLWGHLEAGSTEYDLIKSWQGVYLVCLMPLILVGMLGVCRDALVRKRVISPKAFLVLYTALCTLVVAMSSMETRHLGQFIPAFILLAVMPDTRVRRIKAEVQKVGVLWFAIVVFVHIAWATMRFF